MINAGLTGKRHDPHGNKITGKRLKARWRANIPGFAYEPEKMVISLKTYIRVLLKTETSAPLTEKGGEFAAELWAKRKGMKL